MRPSSSSTVDRVVRGQLCTGCGLCASVAGGAITMQTVAPGYSRPRKDGAVAAFAEQTIAAACPGNVVEPWGAAPNIHPYWGPWFRCSTGHATDDGVRHSASSGGVVTALAVHALRAGLVDRVVHVIADPINPTRNIVVCSSSEADVLAGAGSRYASSSPLADIEQILAEGGMLAFIGKPCDVSALRRLGRIDRRVNQQVPLMLSFFCAGVPSHNGADRVLVAMGFQPEEIESFRYRGNGWPGMAVAKTHDGRSAEMRYEDSWGGHLSKEVQFRCKICPDGVGGGADIACADAWYGGESGYPSFDEEEGRSLILTRTLAGDRHLDAAITAGAVTIDPLSIDAIDAMQPSQARRKRLVRSRLAALTATLQPRPGVGGTLVEEAASHSEMLEELRSFLGTARRIVAKRR